MLAIQLALFVHVVSAIVLLAGVIGGNVLGVMARRATGLDQRRAIVALGAPFERMTTLAVPLTVISGLVALVVFGYSITDLWVLATGAVILALVAIPIVFWNKVGPQVHDALDRGDDSAAAALMRDPRAVTVGRIEIGLGFVIVALMVFRPGWPGWM